MIWMWRMVGVVDEVEGNEREGVTEDSVVMKREASEAVAAD
jgi:hypothetical protein